MDHLVNLEDETSLEDELNEALRRLGLRDWTVVWIPGGSEEERGTVYPDTKLIVVYDREREVALETLIREFLEVRMKAVIRPQIATINALLKSLEKIYYAEKEETIDGLTPLLLRVLKEDFTKKVNLEDKTKVEKELNMALKRLGLRDWTVVWDPGGSEEERGAVYPDTKLIVVYDREREAILETLIHEFIEVKMKAVIRPQLATTNALLKSLEKIYYAEKEKFIDSIAPLLLRVLKEDLEKKEEEAVTAPV